MAEYIEREKLIEHLKKDPLFDLVERYGITGVIDSIQAADVRPVVFCRDCKHYEIDNGWCEYFNVDRVFGDYCSEGVKREES